MPVCEDFSGGSMEAPRVLGRCHRFKLRRGVAVMTSLILKGCAPMTRHRATTVRGVDLRSRAERPNLIYVNHVYRGSRATCLAQIGSGNARRDKTKAASLTVVVGSFPERGREAIKDRTSDRMLWIYCFVCCSTKKT